MSPESAAQASLAPSQTSERLVVVDTLRGFALLGILLSNLKIFAFPFHMPALGGIPLHGPPDTLAVDFLHLFIEGKFYPLFSMLFGLGLILQRTRVEGNGRRFVPLYLRRLAVLFGIGLVHAFLIWSGDILVLYAMLGLPLLLFRNTPRRWLLALSCLLLTLPLVGFVWQTAHFVHARNTPQAAALEREYAGKREVLREMATRGFHAYRGSYLDAVDQRLHEVPLIYRTTVAASPVVFALFLLGLWVGRRGLLHRPEEHRPLLRRLFFSTLAPGLALSIVKVWLYAEASTTALPTPTRFVWYCATYLGGTCLALTYLSGLALLLQSDAWQRRLSPLAAMGRLSLSNYLSQSLVCTTLFYGYGFGLFGKVGYAGQVGIGVIVYAFQMALSGWWVKRFRFGPAEWVWRSLTYGRLQPMRRQPGVVSASLGPGAGPQPQ